MLDRRKTPVATVVLEIMKWSVLAGQMMVLLYCLAQIKAYNNLITKVVHNQLIQLRGIVLMAEQQERHDLWAEDYAKNNTAWRAEVDSILATARLKRIP